MGQSSSTQTHPPAIYAVTENGLPTSSPVVPRLHVDRISQQCGQTHIDNARSISVQPGSSSKRDADNGGGETSFPLSLPITAYTPRPVLSNECQRDTENEAEAAMADLYAPATQRESHRKVLSSLGSTEGEDLDKLTVTGAVVAGDQGSVSPRSLK